MPHQLASPFKIEGTEQASSFPFAATDGAEFRSSGSSPFSAQQAKVKCDSCSTSSDPFFVHPDPALDVERESAPATGLREAEQTTCQAEVHPLVAEVSADQMRRQPASPFKIEGKEQASPFPFVATDGVEFRSSESSPFTASEIHRLTAEVEALRQELAQAEGNSQQLEQSNSDLLQRLAQSQTNVEQLEQTTTDLRQQLAGNGQEIQPDSLLRQRLARAEGTLIFRDSLTNTHGNLYYEVENVRAMNVPDGLQTKYDEFLANLPLGLSVNERRRRHVFHTSKPAVLPIIERDGMRPSHCQVCLGNTVGHCMDEGWFGDHTQGIYVSKHADYTFWYQAGRDPQPTDRGEVMIFEMVTGRVRQFNAKDSGVAPTQGYHCHESPHHLEFYVWDQDTTQRPGLCTRRLLPKYVVSWRAVQNERTGITHDQ